MVWWCNIRISIGRVWPGVKQQYKILLEMTAVNVFQKFAARRSMLVSDLHVSQDEKAWVKLADKREKGEESEDKVRQGQWKGGWRGSNEVRWWVLRNRPVFGKVSPGDIFPPRPSPERCRSNKFLVSFYVPHKTEHTDEMQRFKLGIQNAWNIFFDCFKNK